MGSVGLRWEHQASRLYTRRRRRGALWRLEKASGRIIRKKRVVSRAENQRPHAICCDVSRTGRVQRWQRAILRWRHERKTLRCHICDLVNRTEYQVGLKMICLTVGGGWRHHRFDICRSWRSSHLIVDNANMEREVFVRQVNIVDIRREIKTGVSRWSFVTREKERYNKENMAETTTP